MRRKLDLEEIDWRDHLQTGRGYLTSYRAIWIYTVIGSILAFVGYIYATYWLSGSVVDTVIYTILFIAGLTFFPVLIGLLGAELPWNGLIGRVHVLLGAFAFRYHYLVDRGDRYEWCPGDADRVYIDGQWHDIGGGDTNRSVLGWRPFGILRYKTDETMQDIRVDTAAGRGRTTSADGGEVQRANFKEVTPPAITGIDGQWLVDIKRLYSSGIKKIGDIELVETAEEVIERGEVQSARMEDWKPIIGAMMGLVFGVIVGYVMFVGG